MIGVYQGDLPRWRTHSARVSGASHQAGWPGHILPGTLGARSKSQALLRPPPINGRARGRVEEPTRTQHAVHHHGEPSGNGDGRSHEAEPLVELQA